MRGRIKTSKKGNTSSDYSYSQALDEGKVTKNAIGLNDFLEDEIGVKWTIILIASLGNYCNMRNK